MTKSEQIAAVVASLALDRDLIRSGREATDTEIAATFRHFFTMDNADLIGCLSHAIGMLSATLHDTGLTDEFIDRMVAWSLELDGAG